MSRKNKNLKGAARPQSRPQHLKAATAREWNSHLKTNEYTERRLTFGKYTGVKISELPLDYLKWAIINLPADWADYLSRELQRRDRSYK